jgi:hypothetical protein
VPKKKSVKKYYEVQRLPGPDGLEIKICLTPTCRGSYFDLAERNNILAFIFQHMFFCFFSRAKKRKRK